MNPFLEGEKGNGILKPAVPLAAFTENFSSIDFIAPPPFGNVMDGTDKDVYPEDLLSDLSVEEDDLSAAAYELSFCIYLQIIGVKI